MAAILSKPPVPEEAFEQFVGRWVALRDGDIVADAETRDELLRDQRVESTDTLFKVPSASTHFYPARLA